jgi:hypothetical protein
MIITYWNKTHSFILSWLGSTQVTLDVDIKHIVYWLGSITKSNECEPTKIPKLLRLKKT